MMAFTMCLGHIKTLTVSGKILKKRSAIGSSNTMWSFWHLKVLSRDMCIMENVLTIARETLPADTSMGLRELSIPLSSI